MSKAEVERFVSDLKADANLQSEMKAKATGIPSLIEVAKARGYEITKEDIRQYVHSQGQELTDEQLESTAGGVFHPISGIMHGIVVLFNA
jgi:predicted ribosomally synthesized peptide with nif11-like leader